VSDATLTDRTAEIREMLSRRTCRRTGKVCHEELYTAAVHMRRVARRQGESVGDYNVYRCEFCSLWHIGHRREVDRGD